MTTSIDTESIPLSSKYSTMWQGAIAVMPLSIAVIPWGILAGSFALDVGLNVVESQAMSFIIFAGAAQLAALGMLKASVGLSGILLTTLLITSRHLLYGMVLRQHIRPLPLRWRLLLGFLLTDELFAVIASKEAKDQQFNRWYALGAGLCFYITWNLSSLLGIVAGNSIDNIEQWGLDFAIAATFIALVVPLIKNISVLICVGVSLVCATVCALLEIEAGLIIAALLGMVCGAWHEKVSGGRR